MGDFVMSAPAIRALKQTFSSRITVLTSTMGALVAPYLPEVDAVIVFDLPWIKAKEVGASEQIFELVARLREKSFDAAVIFTVFSQNPLPAAMIAYMAGIPLRLAYCRENPYALLTDWVPDQEPYTFIKHQVLRDLELIKSIGANTEDIKPRLNISEKAAIDIVSRLALQGIDIEKDWLIFHAGVSEEKRQYPIKLWVQAARRLIKEKEYQILFTGSKSEADLSNLLAKETGVGAFSVAGLFELEEFIALVKQAPVVVSVNTGTVHIAAAVNTPVVVLYAQTNPQHTPWMVPSKVLEFEVQDEYRSRNEVIRYLYKDLYNKPIAMPGAAEVFDAVIALLPKK